MEQCIELYGIKLHIGECYQARIRWPHIYIAPQYEMTTRQVIHQLNKRWWSFPNAERLIDFEPANASRMLKRRLKRFIPDLITR